MNIWKKCLQAVIDFIEIYVSIFWSVLLFVALILQTISRYILNSPLVRSYELVQVSYVWIITLGCCYVQRADDNIVLFAIYEPVREKARRLFRLLEDILIVGLLVCPTLPALKFYRFYFTRYSTVFKVPLGFAYLGLFSFQIITIVRYCRDPTGCFREFRKEGKAV